MHDELHHDARFHGPMKALKMLLILAVIAWLGVSARNVAKEYRFIGIPAEQSHTITVSGEGKVNVIPDIATLSLGVTTEKATVAAAQEENTKSMNAVIAALGELGVAKKDIQTSNYSLYPAYDWNDGKQRLRGYTISQNLNVKVRDLAKVGDIIAKAAALGTNQVGGVSFTVDEPEALRQQAREMALEQAKQKADALAKVMDVELVRVVGFDEYSGGGPTPMPMYAKAEGMGGDMMALSAPSIEAGSTDIVVNASVTYEIR